jgi:two-component system OmpR family response regulator
MEELLLRITAVLKRTQPAEPKADMPSHFSIGSVQFDVRRSVLTIGTKKKIQLTTKESELLAVLCAHMNHVVEREQILNAVWRSDTYYSARSMDVYVSKLRKYLKADPKVSIVNVHGKGYTLLVDP